MRFFFFAEYLNGKYDGIILFLLQRAIVQLEILKR